jgi:hypothetical protein
MLMMNRFGEDRSQSWRHCRGAEISAVSTEQMTWVEAERDKHTGEGDSLFQLLTYGSHAGT